MHSRYWRPSRAPTKEQYLGHTEATRLLLRRDSTAMRPRAWPTANTSIRWPITFTARRKQVWGGAGGGVEEQEEQEEQGYVCRSSSYCSLRESHLQTKLVEEVVEEVLEAAEHALVQVAPGDGVKQRSGGGRDLVVAEAVELLVPVDGHLEG